MGSEELSQGWLTPAPQKSLFWILKSQGQTRWDLSRVQRTALELGHLVQYYEVQLPLSLNSPPLKIGPTLVLFSILFML